mgnify:CR=1 FL=1|tara:strand:- start:4941 stop:5879 length:939 start_codon:yes stop_codon:yes gene_type:complete
MKLDKPKFWDKKIGIYSILLFPLSLIFLIITYFKKKFSKTKVFNIPIICVGNIYIGGTGKTPVSIFLAKELLSLKKKPAIIRSYYKEHKDEYNLIREEFDNLILSKKRFLGINEAIKSKSDIVILDDGFQDFTIKKDLNIICFNGNQLIGNGLLIPSGPLRQNLSSIKDADIIIINGDQNIDFEKKLLLINNNLEIYYSRYRPININEFKKKNLLAVAGIGNPENFFQLMEENGLKIQEKIIYPDHYIFSKREIVDIIIRAEKNNFEVIMTEKDFFKIKDFNLKKINYLKVELQIEEKRKLLGKIKKTYENN